ncbi:MAG: sulfatase-like hydrolase/transferase [Verrucomicrobiae bacterium]|nr:sulfatase-like hydrolase/transferase [Verrucomicrobiae bacterium]
MSYETLHAHGCEAISTPNLDTLAESGVSFMNAYNMGGWNGAICVASRTMMQTGRFIWRAYQVDDRESLAGLAAEGKTWPQLMKTAGYETYYSGKWHVKIPSAKIYDHSVHERPGMPNQTDEGYQRPVEGEQDKWSPYERSFEGFWKGGKHWSEVLADDADAFLDLTAKSEKPFFMMLAFNAPHDPRQSPKRFVDMYPQQEMEVPVNYMRSYPFKHEMGAYGKQRPDGTWAMQRDENLAPHPRTEYSVRINRSEYFAIISHMDEQIGRILAKLEATGQKDNTYIFFTADHGLACGNHGLLGKQNMYEHSIKVPFLVAGPDIPKGEHRDAMIHLQDVMATSLDLAGVAKPDYVEFSSLLPLIKDSKREGHLGNQLYTAFEMDLQRMMRVGDYKLIVYPQAYSVLLYNVADDPHEMVNLAGDPSQWPRIKEMFAQLVKRQAEMEDALDLRPYFPQFL